MSSSPSQLRLTLTNDLAEIPRVAEEVERFCEPLEPSMKDLLAIQLALEETITNVISHGYKDEPAGTRRFCIELDELPASAAYSSAPGRSIRLVVRDDAPAYDPLARPPVDTALPLEDRPIGGLGVHLVKNLMQHASYAREDGHNVLSLVRVLNGPAS